MPADSTYWRERALANGHTGWNDQIIYAYDQLERVQLVRALLDRLPPSGRTALDFGCGTGDFSRLLLERDLDVYGYDPFVDPELGHARFTYVATPVALASTVPPVDLVLSITVLDHIVNAAELDENLAQIAGVLRSGGRLLLLEYALDDDGRERRSDYQAFRTAAEWHAVLGRHGLNMIESGPAPHPIECPSAGFLHYRRRPLVRAVRRLRLAHRPLPQRLLRTAARRSLRTADAAPAHTLRSPLQLMVCEKAA